MATRAVVDPGSLFDVAGQSILVAGASGAFGSVAARALAVAGANVTLTGASAGKLEALTEELRSGGVEVAVTARRPLGEHDALAIVEAAVSAHGRLDGLVVASGLNRVAPIAEQPLAQFDEVIEANLRGPWLLCRAAGRQLIAQGEGGKVVLLSSTRGLLGHPAGYSAYCSSKGAITQLTRTLACEWGRHGINVNAIGPTVFRSDLTAWMYADDGAGRQTREAMLARIPLGRLAEPEDFIGTLFFLLSRASDFCTGQVIYVDGGYTAG